MATQIVSSQPSQGFEDTVLPPALFAFRSRGVQHFPDRLPLFGGYWTSGFRAKPELEAYPLLLGLYIIEDESTGQFVAAPADGNQVHGGVRTASLARDDVIRSHRDVSAVLAFPPVTAKNLPAEFLPRIGGVIGWHVGILSVHGSPLLNRAVRPEVPPSRSVFLVLGPARKECPAEGTLTARRTATPCGAGH